MVNENLLDKLKMVSFERIIFFQGNDNEDDNDYLADLFDASNHEQLSVVLGLRTGDLRRNYDPHDLVEKVRETHRGMFFTIAHTPILRKDDTASLGYTYSWNDFHHTFLVASSFEELAEKASAWAKEKGAVIHPSNKPTSCSHCGRAY